MKVIPLVQTYDKPLDQDEINASRKRQEEYQQLNEHIMEITTLLSLLKVKMPHQPGDANPESLTRSLTLNRFAKDFQLFPSMRQKIDALAALAVTDHEVVAVRIKELAAKLLRQATGFMEDGHRPHYTPNQKLEATILVAKNPHQTRADVGESGCDRITIKSIDDLGEQIEKLDSVFDVFTQLCDYGDIPFEKHLGVLLYYVNKVSGQQSDKCSRLHLSFYSILASRKKLQRRFSSKYRHALDYIELTDEMNEIMVTCGEGASDFQAVQSIRAKMGLPMLRQENPWQLTILEFFEALRRLVSLIEGQNKTLIELINREATPKALKNCTVYLQLYMAQLHHISAGAAITQVFSLLSGEISASLERVELESKQAEEENPKTQGKPPEELTLSAKVLKQIESMAASAEVKEQKKRAILAQMKHKLESETVFEDNRNEDEHDERAEDDEDSEYYYPAQGPEAAAVSIRKWLRLLCNSYRYPSCLRIRNPRVKNFSLKMELMEIYMPDKKYDFNWEKVVRRLLKGGKSNVGCVYRELRRRNPSFRKGVWMSFTGRVHCEALICSTCFEVRKRTGVMNDGDAEMRVSAGLGRFETYSPIGVSKRSCPVCKILLESLYEHYGYQKVTSRHEKASHKEVFPYAFPPGLPIEVMKKVVGYFEELLKAELRMLDTTTAGDSSNRRSSGQSDAERVGPSGYPSSDDEIIELLHAMIMEE